MCTLLLSDSNIFVLIITLEHVILGYMLLTDFIYETTESYRTLGIEVTGIILGYSYYYHLSQILQTAAIQTYEEQGSLTLMNELLAKPFNYLGYPVYPVASETTIDFTFANAQMAVRAASLKQAHHNLVISSYDNVIPFKK
jgi:hypothetical protein